MTSLLPLVAGLVRIGCARLLHDHTAGIRTALAALRNILTLQQSRQVPAHIRVTSAVRVHDLLLRQCHNRVRLNLTVNGHNRRLRPLCEHHGSGLRAILLRQLRHLGSDRSDIRLGPPLGLRELHRLSLVPEQNVHKRHQLRQRGLERRHLDDERGSKVQAISLVRLAGVLRHLLHGVRGHRDEKARAVENAALLHKRPVLRLLQVRDLVLVRRRQSSHQRSMNPIHAHTTDPSRNRLVHHVCHIHAILLAHLPHLLRIVILADAPHVCGSPRPLRQPLCNSDGILGRPSSNVHHVRLGSQIRVQRLVLVLRQNRIIRLQIILLQQLVVHIGGHIQQGVAHTKQHLRHGNSKKGGRKNTT
mmetsp:Transcript_97997/g.261624  ORF Transcript_97997/g.261624 Transcript_97997/m.261624 type:complete len:360 (+) Transcript_97997:76-1155(+)